MRNATHFARLASRLLPLSALALLISASVPAFAVSELHKKHACTACHADDRKVIGPAYKEVALRFAKEWKSADGKTVVKPADAPKYLFQKVRKGGGDNWGAIPMPANASASDDEVKEMVKSILEMAKKK